MNSPQPLPQHAIIIIQTLPPQSTTLTYMGLEGEKTRDNDKPAKAKAAPKVKRLTGNYLSNL